MSKLGKSVLQGAKEALSHAKKAKKTRIPVHYIQDVEYILYEFVEKLKECRAHQHTNVLRIPDIHNRFRQLIGDASLLHNLVMEAKK